MEELANTFKQQQAAPQQAAPTGNSMEDLAAKFNSQQSAPVDASPSTDPSFGANVHLANPMGQSLSNIPDGQSVLPTENSLSNEGVSSWEKNGTKWTKVPSFVKKAEMIGTGAAQGMLTFTASLLSLAEKGLRGGDKPTVVPDAYKYWEDKNKNSEESFGSAYTGTGKLAAEALTTAPLGGALGGVAKLAAGAAKIAPIGLKTLGKYGTSALGGAGVLTGMESQKFDPNNPGQLVNADAAGEALSNPMSYAIPALVTKVGTWMEASRKLGEAKDVFPNIMARNLKEPGATTTLSNMFFGIPAALTGMGKQAKQVANIGDDISNFVTKLAGTKEAQTADNLTEYSANIVQSTLKKMGRAEDKIWDQGFKTTPVANPQAVKDDVINAIDLLKTNKIPGYETTVNYLNNGIRKGDIKVDDVKKLQTLVSGAAINAKGLEGGVGNQLADELSGIKDNLLNHIQNSLSPEAMKDFSAARAFSAQKFNLMKSAPLLQKALYDDTSAHKLINTLISEGGVLPPKRAAVSILSPGGRDMVAATKIQQALESSDTAGNINLDSFLTKTSPYTQSKVIMNKDAYDSLQGLNKYLKNIDDASKVGWWRQAAIGGSLASAMGAGAMGAGATGLAIPLVAYGAATAIANHSPLKSLLHAVTKNLPKSTYDLVVKNIEKHLTRAGYLMSDDGVLKHKDDKAVPVDATPPQGIQ